MVIKRFERAETVICSILVKTTAGVLTNPATSMKIQVTEPSGIIVVTDTAMTNDTTGTYHYDFVPTVSSQLGLYKVRYTAVDGTRTTIQDDSFYLQ
jgi:uncharacterized protein YfaS (alpha-2-macroglobulin family)